MRPGEAVRFTGITKLDRMRFMNAAIPVGTVGTVQRVCNDGAVAVRFPVGTALTTYAILQSDEVEPAESDLIQRTTLLISLYGLLEEQEENTTYPAMSDDFRDGVKRGIDTAIMLASLIQPAEKNGERKVKDYDTSEME